MKQLIASLLFAFVVCTVQASPGFADTGKKNSPPAVRLPHMDVQHVALNLKFDWKKKQAYGTSSITLSPLTATGKINLDAGRLTINSVKLGATPLKFEYDGGDQNDGLAITLNRVYQPGEKVTLTINYHTNYLNDTDPANLWGSFGKGLRFFQPSTTEPRERKQIWSMGEPEGNRYWYPGYDSPSDFITTEITATVDKDLLVLSNGNLVNVKGNKDGTKTFHWKMDIPHANHQTSIVVGAYTNVKKQFGDVVLNNYSYPDEVPATDASTERLPDMVKYFSDVTGMKYPYPSYTQVMVQEFPWGGGHNIGFSTMSENMVDDYGTHADFFYLWDGVEAYDLAAQWFAINITPRDWSDAWLGKSMSDYFNGLYCEYKNSRAEYLLSNRIYNLSTFLGDWNGGTRRPVYTRTYDKVENMTQDNYAILHGSSVLHMLRKHLGEENWWKFIRYYVKTYSGKTVATEDFPKAVETATGVNIDKFFDQWIYKMGRPFFEVTKKWDAAGKQLVLTVKQTQKRDSASVYPQVEFYEGKMEMEIDNRIVPVYLEPKAENVFTFPADTEPRLVNFDFEGTWIKEVKFEKTLPELLFQFQNSRDVLAQNTAMTDLGKIYTNTGTSAEDKQKILLAFRNVIQSSAYWRLRNFAMAQMQRMLSGGGRGRNAGNAPLVLDEATGNMLLNVIRNEDSWNRSQALFFLGMTKDPKYTDVYIKYLDDKSDRVINAAAVGLGKTKSPQAFDVLVKLKDKPSWKNQSLISALNGFKELGDNRAFDISLAAVVDNPPGSRWTLVTPTWDYRIAAAQTLQALGKGDAAYPTVLERLKSSIEENDMSDIFNNIFIISALGDPRGQEAFDMAKAKYKDNKEALKALNGYETQFKRLIKK